MLVLARKCRDVGKPGSEIFIGDSIVITLSSARDGVVRIGVSAPRDLDVVRGELLTDEERAEIKKRSAAAE